MKVYIAGAYASGAAWCAYYRKQGRYCFDFVRSKEDASELTEEEAGRVLAAGDYYLKMYGAREIGAEQ